MSSLAFYALLRVREMTSERNNHNTPLQLSQLSEVFDKGNELIGFNVTFHDSKHSYNQRPFVLTIHRQNSYCPSTFKLS